MSPLAGAQDSTATFDVNLSGDTLSERLLWNSVNCQAEGNAAINGGNNCTSNASVYSDQLVGLDNCKSCRVGGSMENAGKLDTVFITMIRDQDPDGEEQSANRCDADLSYRPGDVTPSQFNLRATLGPQSILYTSVKLDSMGSSDVTLVYEPAREGDEPYRHGAIEVATTSGDIDIYCAIASDAPTVGRSGSGEVKIVGGSSNSAEVSGESNTGSVGAIGGQRYNSGNVTVVVRGSGFASATGVSGDEGYNSGAVSATSYGSGEPGAYGATGSNGWNEGEVTSVHSVSGDASAIGSRRGVNMGSVLATTTNGNATAFGLEYGTAYGGAAPDSPGTDMPEEEEMDDSDIGVTFSLYSAATGREIDAFTRTYGSFSWEDDDNDNDDFSRVTLMLELKNFGEGYSHRTFTVNLSNGFSFSPTQVVTQITEHCSIFRGRPEPVKIPIYPLYSEQKDGAMSLTLGGDIRRTHSTPISGNANEGVVLMRATTDVNSAASVPLDETVPLKPVEDFVETGVNRYSDRLALLGCAISQAVYNENYLENSDTSLTYTSLRNLGFSRIAWYGSDSSHDVAVGFAQKTVVANGEVRNVLLIAVRGTVAEEWIGNFNVIGEDRDVHDDFRQCANNVENRLTQYHLRYKYDPATTRTFLCGHSRAGAVVDLVAHDMNVGALSSLTGDLTAYTFAAPNSTKTPAPDSNIFNNYTHGTPYKGVGSELIIQAILASDEIRSVLYGATMFQRAWGYLELTLAGFHKEGGNFIARAHGAENYLSWVKYNGTAGAQSLEQFEESEYNHLTTRLLSVTPGIITTVFGLDDPLLSEAMNVMWQYMPITYPNGATVIGVGCPVDVEFLDSSGRELGRLADHHEQAMEDEVLAMGDGSASFLFIPTGTRYTLRITATGDGTMTVDYAYFRTGSAAFRGTDIMAVYIPNSVREIAVDAFGTCHPTIYCRESAYAASWADDNGFQWVRLP